ncbi:hypothetical protein ACFUJX_19930 [Streptomyces rubiginosohelvolus]|uniref:hypothetical protein n=1 Tax=Streptomyces rubiginosohelvolus TaxID=67362 RepID=UPI0036274004
MGRAVTPRTATVHTAHRRENLRHKPLASAQMDPFRYVADAEAAVARTALLLENLNREHEANLKRLDRARARLGVEPTPDQPNAQQDGYVTGVSA